LDATPVQSGAGPFATFIGNDEPFTLNPLRWNDFVGSVFDEGEPVFTDPDQDPIGLIGMTYHLGYVAPVPEPETYAMLLAGLGLLGFAARRRKLQAAAA
jgi:hypothetical protein